jgi:hypothetical protein
MAMKFPTVCEICGADLATKGAAVRSPGRRLNWTCVEHAETVRWLSKDELQQLREPKQETVKDVFDRIFGKKPLTREEGPT